MDDDGGTLGALLRTGHKAMETRETADAAGGLRQQRPSSTSIKKPASPPSPPPVNNCSLSSSLSAFEVDDRLGKGAYGVVHRARRKQDGKMYVIKTVSLTDLKDGERSEAVNEVNILASIASPYIVKYYDSFVEHDELHIVMEYCNRGDLQRIIYKLKKENCRSLAEDKIWAIFVQIALGLHHLHSRQILHRDMKAANVFVHKDEATGRQFVKIGDLGVAKLLNSNTSFATTMVGTPYYLSPELCQNKRYNERSDVWSLGVLLYQCCTLQLPFEASNPITLMTKIIKGKYEPVSSKYISPHLGDLVRTLLTTDSDLRPSLKQLLSLPFVQEKCLTLGFSLPTDVPVAPLPPQPSFSFSSSSGGIPPEPVSVIGKEEQPNPPQQQQQQQQQKEKHKRLPSIASPTGVLSSPTSASSPTARQQQQQQQQQQQRQRTPTQTSIPTTNSNSSSNSSSDRIDENNEEDLSLALEDTDKFLSGGGLRGSTKLLLLSPPPPLVITPRSSLDIDPFPPSSAVRVTPPVQSQQHQQHHRRRSSVAPSPVLNSYSPTSSSSAFTVLSPPTRSRTPSRTNISNSSNSSSSQHHKASSSTISDSFIPELLALSPDNSSSSISSNSKDNNLLPEESPGHTRHRSGHSHPSLGPSSSSFSSSSFHLHHHHHHKSDLISSPFFPSPSDRDSTKRSPSGRYLPPLMTDFSGTAGGGGGGGGIEVGVAGAKALVGRRPASFVASSSSSSLVTSPSIFHSASPESFVSSPTFHQEQQQQQHHQHHQRRALSPSFINGMSGFSSSGGGGVYSPTTALDSARPFSSPSSSSSTTTSPSSFSPYHRPGSSTLGALKTTLGTAELEQQQQRQQQHFRMSHGGGGGGGGKEAREVLEGKRREMEEALTKTKAQCLELMTPQSFQAVYSFYTSHSNSNSSSSSSDNDGPLSEQELRELEAIVLEGCGQNARNSYIAMFNIQKLLAQEERWRKLKSYSVDANRVLASSSPSSSSFPSSFVSCLEGGGGGGSGSMRLSLMGSVQAFRTTGEGEEGEGGREGGVERGSSRRVVVEKERERETQRGSMRGSVGVVSISSDYNDE